MSAHASTNIDLNFILQTISHLHESDLSSSDALQLLLNANKRVLADTMFPEKVIQILRSDAAALQELRCNPRLSNDAHDRLTELIEIINAETLIENEDRALDDARIIAYDLYAPSQKNNEAFHSAYRRCSFCKKLFCPTSPRNRYCSYPNEEDAWQKCSDVGAARMHRAKIISNPLLLEIERNEKMYYRWISKARINLNNSKSRITVDSSPIALKQIAAIEQELELNYAAWKHKIQKIRIAVEVGAMSCEKAIQQVEINSKNHNRSPLYEEWMNSQNKGMVG